ncbi:methionyl-tRNA formyltransferase [Roseateles saccharophilus]|uniref:Methionyl-tRNA formyltransferase n=1 Tax=Roseateles saccharophilus TaxID=304 RepID=A0A4R3V1N6_ROSSA|nr:methionyl-tRNA formyltransferase [Roseateles saccharophilus]MDG0832403.1 methionyl-tRNA formyltransferase [Roseateles saccharophilus]TCU97098.1 methionyl-tRNA formyltransferase [Roseateles saccharophilus]
MRVVFAGTPEFAAVALDALLHAGFAVPLVLTQPDRPAGRGLKLQASAVKQRAVAAGIPVAQPQSLKLDGRYAADAAAAREALLAADADVMVVAAYGLILPQWVLDLPRLGCLNIHASLLPRWRGAAPIHRAIEAGDTESGITIMQMDAGLDTGAMCVVERERIRPDDTTAMLHDRLAALGGRLVVEALEMAACGGLSQTPQPAEGVSYAHKIEKAESSIDWRQPAAEIERRLRAFDPFPGGVATLAGEAVKLWRAEVVEGRGEPGEVIAPGPVVACGEGALRLTELQRAGGKRGPAAAFLQARPIAVGERFDA